MVTPKIDYNCRDCDGTGVAIPDCETCEGNGWVDDPSDGTMCCPECGGDKCDRCDGTGDEPGVTSAQED